MATCGSNALATSSTTFTLPFVTIEDLLMLDANTLLVINDNNYFSTGARNPGSNNTEFLKIHLANPVPEPGTYALMLGLDDDGEHRAPQSLTSRASAPARKTEGFSAGTVPACTDGSICSGRNVRQHWSLDDDLRVGPLHRRMFPGSR